MHEVRDRRDKHWFWIDDAVVDAYHQVLGPMGMALYMVLARQTNQQGQCYPSMRRLQTLMGDASRNTIKKYLGLLVECGLLHYTTRTDEDGDATSNLYTLLPVSTTPAASAVEVPPSGEGVSTIDRGGSTIDGGVGQPLTGGGSTIDPEGIGFKELGFEGSEDPPPPMHGGAKNFDPQSGEQSADPLGAHNVSSVSGSSMSAMPYGGSDPTSLPKHSRAHGTAPRQLAAREEEAARHATQDAIAACPFCDKRGLVDVRTAEGRVVVIEHCPHDAAVILTYAAAHGYTWPGAPIHSPEGAPHAAWTPHDPDGDADVPAAADAGGLAAVPDDPGGAGPAGPDGPAAGGRGPDQPDCPRGGDQPPLCVSLGAALPGAGPGRAARPAPPGLRAPPPGGGGDAVRPHAGGPAP